MRENLPQTQVNQDGEFLFKLLADNSRVLKGIHIMSEYYAQIEWSNNDDFQGTNSATYVDIFTTAYGIILLYNLLQSLDGPLLYALRCLHKQSPGQYEPPLGDFL